MSQPFFNGHNYHVVAYCHNNIAFHLSQQTSSIKYHNQIAPNKSQQSVYSSKINGPGLKVCKQSLISCLLFIKHTLFTITTAIPVTVGGRVISSFNELTPRKFSSE